MKWNHILVHSQDTVLVDSWAVDDSPQHRSFVLGISGQIRTTPKGVWFSDLMPDLDVLIRS